MAIDLPTVYIVIPVHNRLDATRECLESLRCQTYTHFQVVLIDDGSTDGTTNYVKQHYPEATILKGEGNLWWTGATNLGVRHSLERCRKDDYVLTLNNDTVLPPTYLATMIALAKEVPKALIGSIARDYYRNEVILDQGVKINWLSAKFTRVDVPPHTSDGFYSITALPGRGTLVSASVFDKVGAYDERTFPHYAADYDFSLRASRAGYKLLLHPSCYLYSKANLTGISNIYNKLTFLAWAQSFCSIRSPNNLRIRFRFALKHAPTWCLPAFLFCDFLRVTLGTFRNQLKNIRTETLS